MKREPWRTWKTPDILRVKALEEYLWAKRAQALSENDIAKAFRYNERYMAVSARGTSLVMGTVSSVR
jgi:ABC-type uncharacterized transport system auxiliary subunit